MLESLSAPSAGQREERLIRFLEEEIWPLIPSDQLGRPLPKAEREEILGFGEHGGPRGKTALSRLLQENAIATIPFGEAYAAVRSMLTRFGKGRHPAALNFGDCCTYAIASLAGEPLLCHCRRLREDRPAAGQARRR